jgi:hypothetical protein
MRRFLALATVLLASSAAQASPSVGVMADLGVPDGANGSLVLNPISKIRLAAGGGYNGISRGMRGGITFVPFGTWVTPTLSLEYGNYVEGDANPLAQRISGDPTFHSDALQRIGYSYANAHAGLEFGRKFIFYIHAGMSRITGSYPMTQMSFNDSAGMTSGNTTVTFTKDPSVEIYAVSARIGFVLYLPK